MNTCKKLSSALILLIASAISAPAQATDVILSTPLGDVVIELFDEQAPVTVENFLKYIEDGDYEKSFIHRSVRGFVVQGGGFRFVENVVEAVPTDPAIVNEPGISNTRGTIAMAKISGDPNSATSQWYINIGDNSSQLDGQNGGFTVFGQVKGDGMTVIDAINNLPIWNAGSPFSELPLIDFDNTGPVVEENLVMTALSVLEQGLPINAGMSDSWFNPLTNGQGFLIVIFPEIKQVFIAWFTYDTERPPEGTPHQLGEPGHRWITAQGPYSGDTANLEVFVTEGGIFDAGTPQPTSKRDGTMTLRFSGCNAARISYDIPSIGRQGEVDIQRLALDNVALCETLAGQAAQ